MNCSKVLHTLLIAGSVATGICYAETLVVVAGTGSVWSGKQLLAKVPEGTELVAKTFQNDWFSVQVEVDGALKSGWIHTKDVEYKTLRDARSELRDLEEKVAVVEASNIEAGKKLRKYERYDFRTVFPAAVDFQYGKWIRLADSGIVKSVYFAHGGSAKIKYLNDTTQRVKPDIVVWVLNKDGVVLWEQTDSWLMDSMEPEGSHENGARYRFAIDESLAFSKWARFAWDLKPRYILAVGSKYSYDKLMKRTMDEVRRLNAVSD